MTRYLDANSARESFERRRMRSEAVVLDQDDCRLVLEAMLGVCSHEGWEIHAAHVRTNHVHIALTADDVEPEVAMGKLKAYSSRALNDRDGMRLKRWARHGSTVWLWTADALHDVVEYILRGQGAKMAVYDPGATEPRP